MEITRRDLLKLTAGAMAYMAGGKLVFAQSLSGQIQKRVRQLADSLPEFEGVLVFDEGVCTTMATDFGHYVHNRPLGVLFPKSPGDIQIMLDYARNQKVKVVFRGTAGAAYGQAQVAGGYVIDSSTLSDMWWVDHNTLDLGPGAIWHDVVTFAAQKKRVPLVLPDTLFISVGGTLNAGGMGETSYRLGAQVDNVIELDVVTGAGDFVTCSKRHHSALFHAVLSGMGQCGIITRARIRVLPAPDNVAVRQFHYTDRAQFLVDLEFVAQNEPLGAIGGDTLLSADGTSWDLVITANTWLKDANLDNPSWLASMKGVLKTPAKVETFDAYVNRSTAGYLAAVASGAVLVPHVYIACFMPADQTLDMLNFLLDTPDMTLGAKQLVCMPILTKNFKQGLLPMPSGLVAFHMRIYRKATQEGNAAHLKMLQLNTNDVLPRILNSGGKVYLPFSPLLSEAQRVQHFGQTTYDAFKTAKATFDPDNILTPGAGLF